VHGVFEFHFGKEWDVPQVRYVREHDGVQLTGDIEFWLSLRGDAARIVRCRTCVPRPLHRDERFGGDRHGVGTMF